MLFHLLIKEMEMIWKQICEYWIVNLNVNQHTCIQCLTDIDIVSITRALRLMCPVVRPLQRVWSWLSCLMIHTSTWCYESWPHAAWPRRCTSVVECYRPRNTSTTVWLQRSIHILLLQLEGKPIEYLLYV